MYTADFINKEIDFHTTKNLTSLSAFGSIFWKIFGEPMSIGVKVVLLVDGQHNG